MKHIFYLVTALLMVSAGYSQTAVEYISKGVIKIGWEDYMGAISDFNKAIEIEPGNADAYHWRGDAKAHIQDYLEAFTDLNKAIELDPENADFFYSRGEAKQMLLDYRGAIADYNKSIMINPEIVHIPVISDTQSC
jgi:tetratricopeptide (TPR) repeat protein